jgi:hypothetical protein
LRLLVWSIRQVSLRLRLVNADDARSGADDAPSAAERLALACELFDDALEMLRLRLERQHPDWTDDAIERELERWVVARPGAEDGDVAGPNLRVTRL